MKNRYRSSGRPSAFLNISGLLTLVLMAVFAASPASAQFFQGFETDNVWGDPPTDPIRVASGTNGVPSRTGGFHAEVTGAGIGQFTRWGGYSSVFPPNGYTTSVAVYLDMGGAYANDTRFNWSSAINNTVGAHRRDFIFHGGYYNDAGPYGSGPRFVFTASNNSPGWPRDPGLSPIVVTATGWYRLKHTFYDGGGLQLAVRMDLIDPSGTVVGTWIRSDASDIIGTTVGGNRYGWFPTAFGAFQFPFLAIDDSEMSPVYRWVDVTDGTAGPDDCSGSDTAFTSIQSAVTAAAAGETIKVCPGTYTENVTVPAGKNNLTILGPNEGIPGVDARGPEAIINGSVVLGGPSATSGNTLDGFEIQSGSAFGVMARGLNMTVRNNVINGQAIFPVSGTSAGILSAVNAPVAPQSFNFSNNRISGYRYGLSIDGAAAQLDASGVSSVISGNYVTNNERGVNSFGGFHGGTIVHQISNNTFTANDRGIRLAGGQFSISGNVITNNAGVGGFGIHAGVGSALNALTISGNTIIGNPTNGIFLEGSGGTPTVAYNRIVGNGTGISTTLPALNAENNWWGCNYGPGATGAGCSGTTNGVTGAVDADPWLTLTTSAAPSFVTVGGNATVTSPLTINSNNVDTSGGGNIPDGTPASFGATLGTVLPTSSTTSSGVTSTVFTAGMTEGVGSASTTVDGQTTTVNIPIYNATCAQVSMPTDTTLTGVPITVPIETDLMTGRDAISADFTITYDPAVLTLPGGPDFGVTLGPVGAGRVLTVNQPFLGTLIISVFGPEPFTGNGALVNLNFTNVPGLPFDVSPMNFSSFMYNEGTPCSTTTNGSVTVIGGTITGNVTYGNALVGPAPPRYINNVTISGAGAPPVFTTTDTNGNYSLSGFGPGSYTRSASKTGGIPSGSISAYDSSLIAQHVVLLITLSANQQIVADVSGAGGITSFDAALIARYTVLLPDFGNTGNWIFSPTSYGPSTVYTNLTEDYVGLLMGDVSGNWNQLASEPGGLWDPQGARNDEARRAMVKAPVITANPDSTFEVPVTIRGAVGRGVVAYNFELSYDPNVVRPLENPVTVDDTVSGGLTVVSNAEGGVLRVAAFGVAPIDQDGVLIKVRFRAVGTPGSSTHLSWDNVFLNEDMNGATGVDGSIRIKSPHADEVETELSGRVMTATGERIAKAAVTITDLSGNSIVVYTDRSGVFTIPNVEYGQTYNVTVANTRYTFLPITISISDRAIGLDIVAEQ